ncbi:MAG TPA: serine/threonine-protein kinase [Byssovorax sp.]|jgi:serine/threonine-protein kinase
MKSTEPAGPRTVGRYVLCDQIAAGGMATVHIGRLLGPVGFARTVAIKRLHAQFAKDPEFVAMFLDEARIAARVRHANVVATLDVVVLKGELFVVMDYVHGESIATLLRTCRAQTNGGVPVAIALSVMAGALYGLHAAHEATNEYGAPLRIVHRDVSPQNILVGQDGVPRVVDFGVAKAADRLQTTTQGGLKGKIAYMSPEQIGAHAVDRRTDVYAASVVLWEMLTGRRLFQAESEVRLIQAVLMGEIAPPSAYVPGLPPAIDHLVMTGLSKDPDARFPTAAAMAEAAQELAFATPGQLGAWVKGLGGQSLDLRAARVAQIEGDSARGVAPPSIDEPSDTATIVRALAPHAAAPPGASAGTPAALVAAVVAQAAAPLAPAPVETASQVSAFNMATPVRARRTPLLLAIVLPTAALLGGIAALIATHTGGTAAAPAASSAPLEAPSSALAAPSQSPSPSPIPSLSPSQSPSPSLSQSPSPIPIPSPSPSPSLSPSPSPSQASSAPTATSAPHPARIPRTHGGRCSPPYTVDARGIRVPKMECL